MAVLGKVSVCVGDTVQNPTNVCVSVKVGATLGEPSLTQRCNDCVSVFCLIAPSPLTAPAKNWLVQVATPNTNLSLPLCCILNCGLVPLLRITDVKNVGVVAKTIAPLPVVVLPSIVVLALYACTSVPITSQSVALAVLASASSISERPKLVSVVSDHVSTQVV